jgi:regulator of nucleoside diphosphate kinase
MSDLVISKVDSLRIRDRINFQKNNSSHGSVETNVLLDEIKKAKLLEPRQIPPDVVTMHSIVRLRYLDVSKTIDVQLVYPEEADIKNGKISIFAPVATALLGYRQGDSIEWKVPGGTTRLVIEAILYQPEAAGDTDL